MKNPRAEKPREDYDGTLASLIRIYQTNEISPYHDLRPQIALHYARQQRRLAAVVGDVHVADVTYERILAWQRNFLGPDDHRATAADLLGHLRRVCGFGALVLPEWSGCDRIGKVFASLAEQGRLVSGQGRRHVYLTLAQAQAVIATAKAEGFASIALAQAFQYDCALRQKDVIGEWVAAGPDDPLARGRDRWVMGIRWDEISPDLVLRHKPSKSIKAPSAVVGERRGSEPEEWDLTVCPHVMAELGALKVRPLRGPIVICETTGLPWRETTFRTRWRAIATKAGVPADVQNRDSRPGAATEAKLAGVRTEDVQTTLAHADAATTEIYIRERREMRTAVQKERIAYRQKQASVDDPS